MAVRYSNEASEASVHWVAFPAAAPHLQGQWHVFYLGRGSGGPLPDAVHAGVAQDHLLVGRPRRQQ